MMKYICPICGYDDLEAPPYNCRNYGSFEICICCNFEFGVDEFENLKKPYDQLTKEELEEIHTLYREQWIENGCKVHHPEFYPTELMQDGHVTSQQFIRQMSNIK